VVDFEKELKKVWVALEDRVERTDERLAKLEDKVDATNIGVGLVDSRVADLRRVVSSYLMTFQTSRPSP